MTGKRTGAGAQSISLRRYLVPAILFGAVLLGHLASGAIASGDSRWVVPSAMSFLREGNFDLDEYGPMLEANDYYGVEEIDGHVYNYFPLGMTLIATPFVWIIDGAMRLTFYVAPQVEDALRARAGTAVGEVSVLTIYWRVEHVIACFLIAMAAVVMYGCARQSLDRPRSLIAAFLFAFATPAWSTASRSLGQHAGSILLLAIVLFLILAARRVPAYIAWAGVFLALAYIVRPTNSIPIVLITIYVAVKHRSYFVTYALGAMAVAAPWLGYNLWIYDALLPPYYNPADRLGTNPNVFEALAAHMVSPNRGLLIFLPLVLFSGYGVWLKWRMQSFGLLDALIIVNFALHWVVISNFDVWWSGHAYGPRFWSDLTPFLIYFLFPVIGSLKAPLHSRQKGLAMAFAVCAAWCVFVHFRGATDLAVWEWNREPADVDHHTERIWDWSDLQFLRGIR